MSQDKTQDMRDGRSFEERVFARFDAIDARLSALETQAERAKMETKPIWEQALAEIAETRQEMRASFRSVERQIGVLSKDITLLRADLVGFEERLSKLEG